MLDRTWRSAVLIIARRNTVIAESDWPGLWGWERDVSAGGWNVRDVDIHTSRVPGQGDALRL